MNQNINDFKFCTHCGTRLPKPAVICYRCNTKQAVPPNMQKPEENPSKDENVQDVSFRQADPVDSGSGYPAFMATKEKFDVTNAGFIVLIGIAVATAALFVSTIMMANRDGKFYKEYQDKPKFSSVEMSNERDEKVEHKKETSEYDAGWDETSKDGAYEAGVYEIGVEIPDGVYIVIADNGSSNIAHHAVYADRDQTKMQYGEWFKYSAIVSVRGDGYFSTIRGTAYNIDSFDLENDPFEHEGMFRVGVDLEPGTYRAVSSSSDESYGSWTVHDSVYEIDYNKIYTDGNYDQAENLEITVKEGQILQLKGCYLVK